MSDKRQPPPDWLADAMAWADKVCEQIEAGADEVRCPTCDAVIPAGKASNGHRFGRCTACDMGFQE